MRFSYAIVYKEDTGEPLWPVCISHPTPDRRTVNKFLVCSGIFILTPESNHPLPGCRTVLKRECSECSDFIRILLREFPEIISLLHEDEETYAISHKLIATQKLIDFLLWKHL
jgi:hypothetical protein